MNLLHYMLALDDSAPVTKQHQLQQQAQQSCLRLIKKSYTSIIHPIC
jgi:hypothetical protein